MKKLFLFLVLFLLPSLALAVPVSYYGIIEYDSINSTNTLEAVSSIGTTQKQHFQTDDQTKFLLNHLENPGEKVEFFFKGMIVRRHAQPLPGSIVDLGIVLVDIQDSDGDGISDDDDNCIYIANTDQADIDDNSIGDACENDLDGDGVDDTNDTLIGDESHVTTNFGSFNLKINNSTNTSKSFSGKQTVKFSSGTDTIVEFDFNFSKDIMSMANVTIQKQEEDATGGSIIIAGIDLTSQGTTKTVFLDRLSEENYVCVKDEEIASITELPSSDCSNNGEIAVLCSVGGSTTSGYTCTIINNRFRVKGLVHSGIVESTYTPPAPDDDGGSRGGGSYRSSFDTVCGNWTECIDGKQTRICGYMRFVPD
ncbi:thrombospondin type 3 repeat-containing protein [Bacteroidota bacterium]